MTFLCRPLAANTPAHPFRRPRRMVRPCRPRLEELEPRDTPAAVVSEFPVPTAGSGPETIAAGPDGAVWFTEQGGNKVGRLLGDPAPPAPRPLAAALVGVRHKGRRRLQVVVRYADTGEVKARFNSPFQRPAFRKIAAVILDTDGDGAADSVRLTARRRGPGKKRLTRTFAL